MNKKLIFSLFFALILVVGVYPISANASIFGDFWNWIMGRGYEEIGNIVKFDNAYGKIEAYPKEITGFGNLNTRYCQSINITNYKTKDSFDLGLVYNKKLTGTEVYDYKYINTMYITSIDNETILKEIWPNGSKEYETIFTPNYNTRIILQKGKAEVKTNEQNGLYFYWIENINLDADEERKLDWCFWANIDGNERLKYDIIQKKSSETLDEAETSGEFVKLDPWAIGASAWQKRFRLNMSNNQSIEKNNSVEYASLTFPNNNVGNCTLELRMYECGAAGGLDCPAAEQTEKTISVWNTTYSGGFCTSAVINFKASAPANGERGYYIYYNNSAAANPNYADEIWAFEDFEDGSINNKSGFAYAGGATTWAFNVSSYKGWGVAAVDGNNVHFASLRKYEVESDGAYVAEVRTTVAVGVTGGDTGLVSEGTLGGTLTGAGYMDFNGASQAHHYRSFGGTDCSTCPAHGGNVVQGTMQNLSFIKNSTHSSGFQNRTLMKSTSLNATNALVANTPKPVGFGSAASNFYMLSDWFVIHEGAVGNIDPFNFFNTSLLFSQGGEESSNSAPVINSNRTYPTQGIIAINDNVTFNVNATDANGDSQIKWVNISVKAPNGTFVLLQRNMTKTPMAVNSNWTSIGFFADARGRWNITAMANDGTDSSANTSTNFLVDDQNPNLTLNQPKEVYNITSSIPLEFTVQDIQIDSCWFSLNNGITNTTISSCANTTFNVNTAGTFNLTLYANDTKNNVNQTSSIFKIVIRNLNQYNTTAFEGDSVTFNLTLNASGELAYSDIKLLYNNSVITTEITETGNGSDKEFYYRTTAPFPTATLTDNITFAWNYTVNNGSNTTTYSTPLQTQNVYKLTFTNCSASSASIQLAINTTISEELTGQRLDGLGANPNTTLEQTFTVYKTLSQSRQYSFDRANQSEYLVCIYPVYGNFSVDYDFRYRASGYAARTSAASLISVSNVTKNISLFLVPNSQLRNVSVTIIDQDSNAVSNAVVEAYKYDVGLNSYTLVQSSRTGADGKSYFFLDNVDNQIYQFKIYVGGVLKDTRSNIVIPSTNSLTFQIVLAEQRPTEVQRGIASGITGRVDWSGNGTRLFLFYYSDLDGLASQYCLKIQELNITANFTQTTNCTTSSSNSPISLRVANSSTSQWYAEGGITSSKDNHYYIIDSKSVDLRVSQMPFGKTGLALAFFIIMTLAMVGLDMRSPSKVIIFASLGIGLSSFIGLFWLGWISTIGFIILGLIIASVIRD